MDKINQKEPRAVTWGELEEYQRRGGGGSGEEPPKSLKETIRKAFDDATFSTRKTAKDLLHREMYANDGSRLNELLPHFDRVVRGGVEGWLTARRIIKYGLPEPR